MERQYSVTLNGKHCGKVTVSRQGLYYRICCRCLLPSEDIFRLQAASGSRRENLGVLVPTEDRFGLDTRIPVKQLGEGEPVFSVTSKRESMQGRFVPILDEEPFAYISRLKGSFLEIKEGQVGIRVSDERILAYF